MKKIIKVIVENFKSHYGRKEVDFGDFTAIVGPTDSGKSAFIDAMRLALENTPSGDKFISYKESLCTVEIIFSDNTKIIRRRGKEGTDCASINEYILVDADGNKNVLEKFGAGPVDEVMEFHGMKHVDLFGKKQSLNISGQFDEDIFLAETPEKRAKMIGRMGKLDVVDLALKNVKSDLRQANASSKEYKNEIKNIKEKLKEYVDLPKYEKKLKDINKDKEILKDKANELEKIKESYSNLENLKAKKSDTEKILKIEKEIENLLSDVNKLEKARLSINELIVKSNTLDSLNQNKDSLEKMNSIDLKIVDGITDAIDSVTKSLVAVSQIKKCNDNLNEEAGKKNKLEKVISISTDIESLTQSLDSCVEISKEITKLKDLRNERNLQIERKDKGESVIKSLSKSYDSKIEEWKNALKENKVCPVCASDIDLKVIDNLTDIV